MDKLYYMYIRKMITLTKKLFRNILIWFVQSIDLLKKREKKRCLKIDQHLAQHF